MATISVKAAADDSPRTTVQAGSFTLIIDEPPLFGGENTAPSPVEFLLASLAGCINAIGQWTAREMGFTLRRLEVDVDGDCDGARFLQGDKTQRAGFTDIRAAVRVDADADAETLAEWARQVEDRCPVIDNLRGETTFRMAVEPFGQ